MTRTRAPLWLICDPAASLRLWVAIGLLWIGCRRHLRRDRPVSPEGVAWIAIWLAAAEALLRRAIARQAFRLNGLDPSRVRIVLLPEARDSDVWRARLRTFVFMAATMDRHARRLAGRIRAALAAETSFSLEVEEAEERISPILLQSPCKISALFKRSALIRAPPMMMQQLQRVEHHHQPAALRDQRAGSRTCVPAASFSPGAMLNPTHAAPAAPSRS